MSTTAPPQEYSGKRVRGEGLGTYLLGVFRGDTISHRQARWGHAFTVPILLYVLIIFAIPAVYTVTLSFSKWNLHKGIHGFVGLQSYGELLDDPLFLKSLGNTFKLAAMTVPATLVLGLLAALTLQSRVGLPMRNFYKAMYFMPQIVSGVAAAFVWKWMFNPSHGLANSMLRQVGLPERLWLDDAGQVLPSIAIITVWGGLGFAMVVFTAGLEGIPRDYYDASSIDGANTWQQFWRITFPLLNPQIVMMAILSIIGAMKAFAVPFTATKGGPMHASRTIVLHIYDSAFQYFYMSRASAAALVLFFLILGMTLIQRRLITRRVEY